MERERLVLGLLLAATFAVRAIHPGQPIVENYVGRQIPTAMVARNLERGSGFFHPELDTGPFPNLFLVEPPIYAQAVAWLRPIVGFDLEATGRLVSALAITLAAWGLFGLARRREGLLIAYLAVASFALFPVMIRYGRAFQPDALMLGCVLAGLRAWDEFEATGDRRWAGLGGFVLAVGLALKITVAWTLIPFVLIVRSRPVSWKVVVSATMLAPSLGWYLYAWGDVASPGMGSMASSDNASLWIRSLSLFPWLRLSTWASMGRGLAATSFTPVGFVLASWGLVASGRVDRLWIGWGVGCALSILGLAAKWHHAYYWMVVAPPASVGVARGLASLARVPRVGRPGAAILGSSLLTLCLLQSASTWSTPVEWRAIVEAGRAVASFLPESDHLLVVAPEALLYYSDRRGARLEFEEPACRRAAGEWGIVLPEPVSPLGLVDSYRSEVSRDARASAGMMLYGGVALVADSGEVGPGSRRANFRQAVRSSDRYRVLIDRPDLLIARPL